MEKQALAIKYRPKCFKDVYEQDAVVHILQNQLNTNTFKHAYLFAGRAGCGKTTCARILANAINRGHGNPLEMDAASNSGVDDVRKIIQQAQTQSIDSEYKVFIIDECHAISNAGWQAFLKLIEEPPAKSVFIFCTTDPQKIPTTILSRVQYFQFKRLSSTAIYKNLAQIAFKEDIEVSQQVGNALQYIAELADGGMRDAITLMDKCLSYSRELSVDAVNKIVGNVSTKEVIEFINNLVYQDTDYCLRFINDKHLQGIDMRQFINQLYITLLKISIYHCTRDIKLSGLVDVQLDKNSEDWFDAVFKLLSDVIKLKSAMRYESNLKLMLNAWIVLGDADDWTM